MKKRQKLHSESGKAVRFEYARERKVTSATEVGFSGIAVAVTGNGDFKSWAR